MKIVEMYDLDEFAKIVGIAVISVQTALFYPDYADIIYVDDAYIENAHERFDREIARCSDTAKDVLRERKNTLDEILLKMDSHDIPRQFILRA